jgi:pimeloyl-ACP methyl ester carboxylesterase
MEVAAERGRSIAAVVAAGLAWDEPHGGLHRITAPTMLVSAEKDNQGLAIARECLDSLTCRKRLELVHGTGSLGNVLDKVARIACLWYEQYLV